MNDFSSAEICIESEEEESDPEGVLSEVHVHPGKPPKLNDKFFISRYPILLPQTELLNSNGRLLSLDC
jgi:hypothetical protein